MNQCKVVAIYCFSLFVTPLLFVPSSAVASYSIPHRLSIHQAFVRCSLSNYHSVRRSSIVGHHICSCRCRDQRSPNYVRLRPSIRSAKGECEAAALFPSQLHPPSSASCKVYVDSWQQEGMRGRQAVRLCGIHMELESELLQDPVPIGENMPPCDLKLSPRRRSRYSLAADTRGYPPSRRRLQRKRDENVEPSPLTR